MSGATLTMETEHPTKERMRMLIEQVRDGEPLKEAVAADTRFVGDLGLSSLELIGLVFLCEQTFHVDLVNDGGSLAELRTVGQAMGRIRALQERGRLERSTSEYEPLQAAREQ